MIVGREMLNYFEGLSEKQTRIYPDAADFGIRTSEFDLDEARANLRQMMDWFEYESEKWNETGVNYKGGKVSMFIPYEQEGDLFLGVTLTVEYHNLQKPLGDDEEYLTIMIERASSKKCGLK